MAKQKLTKQQRNAKENEENKRFLMIVGIATLVLMILMYFIFTR